MRNDLHEKLVKRYMTRREFLQFMFSSFLVLFGLSNIIAFMMHVKKTAEPVAQNPPVPAAHGFGSRKFGA